MINNIQTLRALAAILVVWVHCQGLMRSDVLPAWMGSFGYGGVDLFFVISGFIMVHTTRRKQCRPGEFFKRRLIRIVPLYYFFTIGTSILAVAFPVVLKSTTANWPEIIQSLLFFPYEKTQGRVYPVYYLGWTLNYEMFFYAIFAVSLALSRQVRVFFVAAVLMVLVTLGRRADGLTEYGTAAYFYTRPILLDFVCGMLIAVAIPASKPAMYPPLWWMALVAGGVWLVCGGMWFNTGTDGIAPPTDTFFRFGIGAILVVAGAVALERAGTLFGGKIGSQVADASYSIYLAHYFFVGGVIAVADASGTGPVARTALVPITMALAIGVGFATYLIIERPLAGDFRALRSVKDVAGYVYGYLMNRPTKINDP